ncbi:MAG: sulfite exporter TauE/SafE family protein [Vicinamibacteria bacterium]
MTPPTLSIDLLGFLALGFLGGFGHCVGMCAPFVLLVSRRFAAGGVGRGAALSAQAWYAAGRVTTYAVLGAAAGFAGSVVELAGSLVGLQRAATVLAGGVLVAEALLGLTGAGPLAGTAGGRLFARASATLGRRAPRHPFGLGLLLGLLPCGLLYSALVAAVSRGSAAGGALAVLLFGLGTTPALLGLSLADELLARRRARADRVAHVFLLAMGLWFVWSGLRG